jgi:hypothetical protein
MGNITQSRLSCKELIVTGGDTTDFPSQSIDTTGPA